MISITLFGLTLAGCVPSPSNEKALRHGSAIDPPVRVVTDKLGYHRGEAIVATIRNDLTTTIFAPAQDTVCAILLLERGVSGQWLMEDPCPSEPAVRGVSLPPKGVLQGRLSPALQEKGGQDPEVGQPVAPDVFKGDVRSLPPSKTWKPGDPVYEVPRGTLSFSGRRADLPPGTYRLAFRFTTEPTGGPVQVAYTQEFVVAE